MRRIWIQISLLAILVAGCHTKKQFSESYDSVTLSQLSAWNLQQNLQMDVFDTTFEDMPLNTEESKAGGRKSNKRVRHIKLSSVTNAEQKKDCSKRITSLTKNSSESIFPNYRLYDILFLVPLGIIFLFFVIKLSK